MREKFALVMILAMVPFFAVVAAVILFAMEQPMKYFLLAALVPASWLAIMWFPVKKAEVQ